jgi:NAD(P)H-dependent FMN reductase
MQLGLRQSAPRPATGSSIRRARPCARVGLDIPVLLGTIRQERKSEWVARYVVDRLAKRPGVTSRLVDPRDLPFGNLDQREWEMDPQPPEVAAFVRDMARADGFVVVTPEYNWGYPGTLKNLLDALYDEWNRKPFALVGVGGISGGLRAIDNLRQVVGGLGAIVVPSHVPVAYVTRAFTPEGPLEAAEWDRRFEKMFEELEWYASALQKARAASPPS